MREPRMRGPALRPRRASRRRPPEPARPRAATAYNAAVDENAARQGSRKTLTPEDRAALVRDVARAQGAARAAGEREAAARLVELLGVVFRLRDEDGCPWDRSQSLDSMAQNLLEEAAETHEAIAGGADPQVCEELGDTLMNVLLMARIAEQEGRFGLADVAAGIAEKLVRRHPHVFGDRRAADVEQALQSWNEAKAEEKRAAAAARRSVLDGVPEALPALLAALRTGEKAAGVGFDWPDAAGALQKLEEEVAELREAAAGARAADPADAAAQAALRAAVEEELGDALFSAVNVARKHGIDPELALRRAIGKFRRRFAVI